jgi:trk system potassium uptake protein TrkH
MLSQKPKIIGIFLMFLSITMLSPLLVDYIYTEKNAYPYILSFTVTFSCGFFLWFISRNTQKKLSNRDGFLIVTLVWMFVTVFIINASNGHKHHRGWVGREIVCNMWAA